MKTKIVNFFKKNFILISIILIILVVLLIFGMRKKIDVVSIKNHDLYQYLNGIKVEYTGEIVINKETESVTQLTIKDVSIELDSHPIYFKNDKKLLFPKNMLIAFPVHGEQYKVNYYTTIYEDITGVFLRDRSLRRTIKDAIIFDGDNIYCVVDNATVSVNNEEVFISPLSFIIVDTQNKITYVYDRKNDELYEFTDVTEDVIISTSAYKVNASLDYMHYGDKTRLFIKSVDKLKNLDK